MMFNADEYRYDVDDEDYGYRDYYVEAKEDDYRWCDEKSDGDYYRCFDEESEEHYYSSRRVEPKEETNLFQRFDPNPHIGFEPLRRCDVITGLEPYLSKQVSTTIKPEEKADSSQQGSSNAMMSFEQYINQLEESEEYKKKKRRELEEQKRTEEEAKKKDAPKFYMRFNSFIDSVLYSLSSEEEKEEIRHQQMVERGFIEEVVETVEEVVETVREVATRTVSRLRQRMNILKSMMKKKSYTLVKHDNKVSDNTPEFRFATELQVEESVKTVLATDNAIFNRSVFPDTS